MSSDNADSSATAPEQPSLALVGGGIAGVLLALAITKNAPHLLPITLYESAHQFGEIGAGVAFGPNAVHAMHSIGEGVRHGFEKCATGNKSEQKQQTYFDFREGMDRPDEGRHEGQLIAEVTKGDQPSGMVHRANFLDEMLPLLPDTVKVEFKKRLVELQEQESTKGKKIKLKFADGSEALHSAVVGCDGIKSRTRMDLLGEDDPAAHAVFTGKYCYRGLIPMDQAIEAVGKEMATNSQMYLGYHGHMLTFPVQKGKVMNVVAFSSAEKWENENWVIQAEREKMYQDFEKWGNNVRNILKLMQKPDIWALFNHLPAKTYHRGRLCVTGDAAHASSPHQGSGASMAVEDALVMSKILSQVKLEDDFDAAFAAFDTVRRPRTQKLVWTSKECGEVFDMEGRGIEGNVEKLAENLHERHWWIWGKNVDEDADEGQRIFHDLKQRA